MLSVEHGPVLGSMAAPGPGTHHGMELSIPYSHPSSYTRVSTKAQTGEDKTQANIHEFGLLQLQIFGEPIAASLCLLRMGI